MLWEVLVRVGKSLPRIQLGGGDWFSISRSHTKIQNLHFHLRVNPRFLLRQSNHFVDGIRAAICASLPHTPLATHSLPHLIGK